MSEEKKVNLYWFAEVSTEVLDAIEYLLPPPGWFNSLDQDTIVEDWLKRTRESLLKVVIREE